MGRGKLPLKLIEKERARRITCMKRKNGLVKKAYELSTLCDVRVCLIIYDSAATDSPVKTWPECHKEVERIVADYLAYKAKNPSAKRDLNLSDFFNDRIKKLKQQNQKLALKQAGDHHYRSPSVWDTRIDDFSEDELFELLVHLDAKIAAVDKLKAERAMMIQCVAPLAAHQENNNPWLGRPSSSNYNNNNNALPIDQTMPFDLNACLQQYESYDHHNSSVINGSDSVDFPCYTNLLEGGGLPDWYGLGLTVPDSSAIFGNYSVDTNPLLQPYDNIPVPMLLRCGTQHAGGNLQYFPGLLAEPFYDQSVIGGPSDVDRDGGCGGDPQSIGGSAQEDVKKVLLDNNMDLGFGNATAGV